MSGERASGFVVFGNVNHEPSTPLSSHADIDGAMEALPARRVSYEINPTMVYDDYSIMDVETLNVVSEWAYYLNRAGAPCFWELKQLDILNHIRAD